MSVLVPTRAQAGETKDVERVYALDSAGGRMTEAVALRNAAVAIVVLIGQVAVAVPVVAAAMERPAAGLAFQSNQAPTATAGPDQTLTVADPALLVGKMSDDGLPDPEAVLTSGWSVLNGPGTVEFADAEGALATATFSTPGSYLLRFTVDDGELTASDETAITVIETQPAIVRVPEDHPTIQSAIDAAQAGDLVLVGPGTYVEDLDIPKTITLASHFYTTGDPTFVDQTVIAATDATIPTIFIGTGAGIETRVVGFTIRDGDDGVLIDGIASIIDNRFIDLTHDAVDFQPDSLGSAVDNVMENNGDDAVDVDRASVLIQGNLMQANSGDGVEIRTLNQAGTFRTITIRDNVIVGNTDDGIQVIDNDSIAATNALLVFERNVIEGNLDAGIGLMDGGVTKEDFRAASLLERIHVFNNTSEATTTV